MAEAVKDVTGLLHRIEQGDSSAAGELLPVVYQELRARAGRLMNVERKDHTLQRTALVHEAYLKLVRPGVAFSSRLHFFNASAMAMRRILLDHAAEKNAQKRGGGARKLNLEDVDVPDGGPSVDVIALDEAMNKLAEVSPRQAQVVNLRFFAGLSDAEIAELLDVAEKTVQRDWATARLWLYDQISR